MELRHLTTFLSISRLGSFVKAAEHLNYAQSTITLHIQELETELGARLLDRTRGTLTLTEAGQALQGYATRIVREVDGLHQSIADLLSGEGGRVAVGAMEPTASLRLSPILARFSEERPAVKLSVEVAGTDVISAQVARGSLDFGICSPPIRSLELSFEPLFVEPMALLLPATHALARGGSVNGDALIRQRIVVSEETCAYRKAFEKVLAEMGLRPTSVIEISSVTALLGAVQAGLGIALVPVFGATPPPPQTVLLPLDGADPGLTIGIVQRSKGPPLGRAAEALASFIQDRLRAEGDKTQQKPKHKTRGLSHRKFPGSRS